MSVPQFGDWDQKGPLPDYSLDFSKIREMRKQNKRDISRASIGNEDELVSSNTAKLNTTNISNPHHSYDEDHHSPTVSTAFILISLIVCLVLLYYLCPMMIAHFSSKLEIPNHHEWILYEVLELLAP